MSKDLIDRQAAIDALKAIRYGLWEIDIPHPGNCPGYVEHHKQIKDMMDITDGWIRRLTDMPSAQPERLSDDDFETIRIHLSAAKERLCNQHRWKEAEEYQRIIDRFMAFASAQPEIIRCKDCKHFEYDHPYIIQGIPVLGHEVCNAWGNGCKTDENGYCFMAERRTDGSD